VLYHNIELCATLLQYVRHKTDFFTNGTQHKEQACRPGHPKRVELLLSLVMMSPLPPLPEIFLSGDLQRNLKVCRLPTLSR